MGTRGNSWWGFFFILFKCYRDPLERFFTFSASASASSPISLACMQILRARSSSGNKEREIERKELVTKVGREAGYRLSYHQRCSSISSRLTYLPTFPYWLPLSITHTTTTTRYVVERGGRPCQQCATTNVFPAIEQVLLSGRETWSEHTNSLEFVCMGVLWRKELLLYVQEYFSIFAS